MKKIYTLLIIVLFTSLGYSQLVVTVGNGNVLAGTTPINSCYGFNYSQQIYTVSDLTSAGAIAGPINSVSFYYDNGGTTTANWATDWVLYLGETSQSSFATATDWVPLSGLTQVFSGSVTAVAGNWVTMTLTTPFSWNGTSNLVIAVDENTSGWSCTAQWPHTNTTNVQSMYYRSDATNPDPASPPAAFAMYNNFPNLRLDIVPSLTALASDTISTSCYGATTDIPVTIAGGTPPFSLVWSTGQTSSNANDTLFNVGVGTYSITVTDNVGDMDTAFITVVEPDSIAVNASVITQLICDYDISLAEVVGSGGTPLSGYFTDTNSANFNPDTSQTGTLVTLGDDATTGALPIEFEFEYFGNIYDEFYIGSNGYVSFGQGYTNLGAQLIPNTATPNNAIGLSWADMDPNSGVDGEISYYTIGTAPNRTLIVNFDDVPHYPGPASGTATVQLKLFETSNCIEIHTTSIASDGGTITQGIENSTGTEAYVYPGRNASVWSSGESFMSFCPVDSTGLLYSWSDGSTGSTVLGLSAGTYTVTASDASGCFATDEITINAPTSAFVSNLNADDVSCFGFDDATIDPGISGGVSPIVYTWSNSQSTSTLSGLEPGVYSVSAEDAVGCTIEVNNIVIQEPTILLGTVYGVENNVCSDDLSGTASIVVSGGSEPYSPIWSNGEVGFSATSLPTGGNYVQVVDANGCSVYLTANVQADFQNPTPEIGNSILNQNGGTVTLNTAPISYASYLWKGGSTASQLPVTQTGYYWVEVTNQAGCVGSDTVYVEIWPLGVEDLNSEEYAKIYPNPANGFVNLEFSEKVSGTTQLKLIDTKGSVVYSETLTDVRNLNLDVSNLAVGVYNLSLSNESIRFNKLISIVR